MDPIKIINQVYKEHPLCREILIEHSSAVAQKALKIGQALGLPDDSLSFIQEAAMLHDIGIFLTHAPEIHCHGSFPYLAHGFLGHDLLKDLGYPKHALVCERHTGTGLSLSDITKNKLPVPQRPMEPISLEEQIICYADKFFSKDPNKIGKEKKAENIMRKLRKFGTQKEKTFHEWHLKFGD